MARIDQPLTDDASRKLAVETTAQATLVVAGAGSGKTSLLIDRVAHLLQHGVSASQLMVLTFTRKAAGEIMDRLSRRLCEQGGPGAERQLEYMLIGTFHSVFFGIVRDCTDQMPHYSRSLTVIEPDDVDLLLTQAASDLGYYRNGTWKSGLSKVKVLKALEHLYTTGEPSPAAGEQVKAIVNEYRHQLAQYNVLDFGSILLEARRLLCYPAIRKRYTDRIKHVLVDEVQDTNPIQHELLSMFYPAASLFAVGDRRQSIYGFRGAAPELMDIMCALDGSEVIHLQVSYRCPQAILDPANNLIAHNRDPLVKPMYSATDTTGEVHYITGRSADIALAVKQALGMHAPSEIAVLTRTNRTARRTAEVLAEHDVPCYRVGRSHDICATPAFKALAAALTLCVNPRDNLAFLRLRNALGVDTATYAVIRSQAARERNCHLKVYLKLHDAKPAHDLDETIADRLAHCFLQSLELDPPLPDTIAAYVDALIHLTVANGEPHKQVMEFWQKLCEPSTPVADALLCLRLRDSQDDLPTTNVVTVLTAHAAKGLEWPVVFVVDLNEGNFPASKAIKEDSKVLEERRLCYVAMTRSKEQLYVHHRRAQDQSIDHKIKPPSRFLAEMHETAYRTGDKREP